MHRAFAISALLVLALPPLTGARDVTEAELKRSSDEHMREELGVNPITAPSIQSILKGLEVFRPIPLDVIDKADRDASFNNRFQTAMHFGSLVADGFMLTLAERPQEIQNIGRSLIRESRALGVGGRLTKRSKSLFEHSDKGDWIGMRQELMRTQQDVETSMLELHDEEMAHMIRLGGWLRGFQLGAVSTASSYTPDKAKILGNVEIMDYFLDRLDTLHPRLKKTEMVTLLIARVKQIRTVAMEAEGKVPSPDHVAKMRDLANEAEEAVTSRVDDEGRFIKK